MMTAREAQATPLEGPGDPAGGEMMPAVQHHQWIPAEAPPDSVPNANGVGRTAAGSSAADGEQWGTAWHGERAGVDASESAAAAPAPVAPDRVTQASMDSFPASDPPGWISMRVGG